MLQRLISELERAFKHSLLLHSTDQKAYFELFIQEILTKKAHHGIHQISILKLFLKDHVTLKPKVMAAET